MLISWNWLNRHVDLSGLDPRATGELFTLHVAELDGVHEIGAGLEDLRAVLVEAVEPHPGSEKLTLVSVADGDARQTLVCGAPNAREALGKVVVLAGAGATLPDGTVMGSATIRGVKSEGMLLSERELGLSDDHSGILILGSGTTPGQRFIDAAPVHDWVWEVDNKAITHRPDLWGHHGIAREVALLVERDLRPLDPQVEWGTEDLVSAEIRDLDLCPRYVCAYFRGVAVTTSPEWLRCLLRATGVRPISNVVDLTNFVMMDVGEPMHAFDARFVAGHQIIVRRAEEGEIARTLDGQDRICNGETLLICDASGPVAIAGVMGGENSEIRNDTTEVILEAANFHPGNIRRTSVRLGLRTESSARFEKSLDPVAAGVAARHFAKLMVDLIPSCTVASPMVDVGAELAEPPVLELDPALVSERLGVDVAPERTRDVLERLGFGVEVAHDSGLLRVSVPSWRATKDIAIPEDLIEEIGRMHGYANIPPEPPRVAISAPRLSKAKAQERAIRRYLSDACGMYEVLSYAFTQRPMLEKLGADLGGRLEMANTISAELDRMRRSLVPNLLTFGERNSRNYRSYGLYEIGRVFHPRAPGELPDQPRHAGFLLVHDPKEVAAQKGELDGERQYRLLRGIAEGLLTAIRAPQPGFRRSAADEIDFRETWVHPARSATILAGDVAVGLLTLLHPRARQALDLPGPASLLELDLDAALTAGQADWSFASVPRFPAIGFDVSFDVAETVTAAELEAAIRAGLATELLRSCELFANYHLGDGRKSVSFRMEFRSDDRSLEDTEVHERTDAMIAHVSEALGATLRGG